MQIRIPDVKAPVCQCGEETEVYLDPYVLRVKCTYCGKEASMHYNNGFYRFSVNALASLVAIIGNSIGE